MVWRNAVDIQGKNLRADSWMGEYFCQFESKSKVVNFVKIAIKNGHLLQTKKQMSWRFHPRDVDVKNTKRHTDDDEHKDINTLAVAVGEVKEESQNNERSTNLKKTIKNKLTKLGRCDR